jgi:transcriptional regulator NrdR family protein
MVEFVIKSNGQKEAYQKEKVINSLKKLNLSQKKIEEILLGIDRKLPSVISTKKLFDFIFSSLKEKETSHF